MSFTTLVSALPLLVNLIQLLSLKFLGTTNTPIDGLTLDESKIEVGQTMAFATLTLARLFHGFTCRSEFSIFKIKLTSNMWSLAAFATGVLLLAFVLFVPFMHTLFMVEPLDFTQVCWIVLLAFLPTALIQMFRVIKERMRK